MYGRQEREDFESKKPNLLINFPENQGTHICCWCSATLRLTSPNFNKCKKRKTVYLTQIPSGERPKAVYNIARVLALCKSYWAAMNKIFIYARSCVNKMTWTFFVHCCSVIKEFAHAFSCAYIELWMHLGSLESTQKARVALGCASSYSYAFFVLSKLPACIHNSMYAR